MVYQIEFIAEATTDYKTLDGSLKAKVDKKLEELSANPFLGDKLGNKFGINLAGFLKLYVDRKRIRIVYRLISPEKVEIIEIWGIGKREKEEIYRTIGKRLDRR